MDKKDIENIYYSWEKQLEEEYINIFPNAKYTIFDGVISPSDYFNSPIKVMFLNREAYDEDFCSYNITKDGLKKELDNGAPIFRGRYWINQNMKERLAYCSMLDHILDYSEDVAISQAQNMSNREYRHLLYKSAYTNIKKSDGVNGSTKKNLLSYAQRGWNIIEKQISFFNPTIIIGGNIIEKIVECIEGIEWGEDVFDEKGSSIFICQIKIGGKFFPIVDMYHPSYTCDSQELFYALKTVAQRYPGFWESRIGQKCFEFQQSSQQITNH